ncbi:hypothetical protein D3C86_1251320 [compost metagenome]
MALAARADDLDQVGLGQHGRGAQDGLGHVLGLIIGQPADQLDGRIDGLGEFLGQFGANGDLHGVGQVAEHRTVEGRFGLAALGRAEEVVGQFAQQGAALLAGRLLSQGDQVGQARGGVVGRKRGGAVAHGRMGSWLSGRA